MCFPTRILSNKLSSNSGWIFMKNFKFLLDPMRLPFLILTPACVVLGLATAIWTSGQINWFHFVLVLIGALSAHISVNTFNEYFDFKSGLDANTKRTPFSGGSGRLPETPEIAQPAFIMAWIFFGLSTFCRWLNSSLSFSSPALVKGILSILSSSFSISGFKLYFLMFYHSILTVS